MLDPMGAKISAKQLTNAAAKPSPMGRATVFPVKRFAMVFGL
jgi:hypothetical protein